MKILLTSIGTRGDVEPFLALGEKLTSYGHDIHFAFPEQFSDLVPDHRPFYPLSAQFLELIESEAGQVVMGGKASLLIKMRSLYQLYRRGKIVNRLLVEQQYEIARQAQPDKIIHNSKCSYPSLWSLQTDREAILISSVPYFMYYVKGHAHVGFKGNLGGWLNRLTYRLANFGLLTSIGDAQKSIPGNTHFSRQEIRQELFSKKLIYAISPTLFARPAYWPSHVHVSGFMDREIEPAWQPSKQLTEFVIGEQKILFLSFGSMVNRAPEELSAFIYSVLIELGIKSVVNTASGGLLPLKAFKQSAYLHFEETIPYAWILQRAYAVVHHGGSGTTHLGLKYGCPTLILPHILDQFGWNTLVHRAGAGPKGVAVNELSRRKFTSLLQDLMHNPAYLTKANQLSQKMQGEAAKNSLADILFDKKSVD